MPSSKPATCHPDKRHQARGLCGACYQNWWNAHNPGRSAARMRSARPAACHPDEPMLALGLCSACYRRQYRINNPDNLEQERARNRAYRNAQYLAAAAAEKHRRTLTRYRLTVAQWDTLLVSQQGRCAACTVPLREPQVDHCHETGTIRGLLCGNCNSALGHAKDDVERLRALIDYLTLRP